MQFPRWETFTRELIEKIDVEAGETRTSRSTPRRVWLPDAMWDDLFKIANSLDWTPDQVVSYFTIRGVLAAAEDARRARDIEREN